MRKTKQSDTSASNDVKDYLKTTTKKPEEKVGVEMLRNWLLRYYSRMFYVTEIINLKKQNTPIRMSSTKKMTPITKKPEITQPHVQPTHVQPTQVQPTQSLPKQPILIDLTDDPTPTQQPMTSSAHPIINLSPSMLSKPTPSTPTRNPQSNSQQLTPQQIAMKRFLATQKLLLEKKLIPK